MSDTTTSIEPPSLDMIVGDVFLWRRKKLSGVLLVVSTLIWVLMEVYQFNLVPLLCWVAMFVVTAMFLWGITVRLLGKEEPDMSTLEVTEQSVVQVANSMRTCAEEAVRWMFRVGAEGEWFSFAGIVAGLWLLSKAGSYLDLLTFLYIGIVVGMIVPVMYQRYEENIRRWREQLKVQARRVYDMADQKVIKNVESRIHWTTEKKAKDKKTE